METVADMSQSDHKSVSTVVIKQGWVWFGLVWSISEKKARNNLEDCNNIFDIMNYNNL